MVEYAEASIVSGLPTVYSKKVWFLNCFYLVIEFWWLKCNLCCGILSKCTEKTTNGLRMVSSARINLLFICGYCFSLPCYIIIVFWKQLWSANYCRSRHKSVHRHARPTPGKFCSGLCSSHFSWQSFLGCSRSRLHCSVCIFFSCTRGGR